MAQSINTSENYKKNYKKAQGFISKYPDSTSFFATQALLSAQTNDQRADVYYLLGKMAKTQEWFNIAILYYQKSLKLYSDNKDKNKARLALVTPYRRLKKYNTALRMVRWVNQYMEEKNDSINLINSYSSLGNIFYNLSQADTFSLKWVDSSLYYHRRSIAIRKKSYPKNLAQAYYNSSFAYEAISPDSAIYYTKLAISQQGVKNYYKALYNIRLAQINYEEGDYKEGQTYLDIAQQIPHADLNLQNMHCIYQAMISLNLQDLPNANKYFNKYDSLIYLLSANSQNMADRKGVTEMIKEDYQNTCDIALKLYKATKNEKYLGLMNKYKRKKEQASRKYEHAHQLIEQKDSLLLSKEDNNAQNNPASQQMENRVEKENNQHWFFWGIMITIITIAGGWSWWHSTKPKKQNTLQEKSKDLLTNIQGLNTDLLSSLASHNEFEKILSLLSEHLGVNVIEQNTDDSPHRENFTAREKVYMALLTEGFTQWEIRQMLNQSKKDIISWEKKIKQKMRPA